MPLDTDSPGFVVGVVSRTREIQLAGKKDPAKLGQALRSAISDVTSRITSFTFEDSENELSILRLVVDNEDLLFFDHPAWTRGNLVKFHFGYPGRTRRPEFFVVDSLRGFTTLNITCVEETALANVGRCRVFKNKTRIEVIQEIVNQPEGFPGVDAIEADFTGIKEEKPRDHNQAGLTDLQFLMRLAEKPGYEVYVQKRTLHFHPRKLGKSPARKFEYFYGEGALRKFNVTELRVLDRVAETEVRSMDPISRKTVSSTGSDSKTERTTLGSRSAIAASNGNLGSSKRIVRTPDSDQASVRNEANTHYRRQEEVEVKATAIIEGDPELEAKEVVEIVGISGLLSGKYYITKHVHRIDVGGGYTGTLTLIKNALSTTASSDPPTQDKTKARENRSTVPKDPRGKIVTKTAPSGESFLAIEERNL